MKTWTQLRDLTRQINKVKEREYKFPAIDTNPPESEGINFNPSGEGSGSIGPRSEYRGNSQWGRMAKTKSEEIKISELLPNPYNRTLDRNKVDKIKQDIKTSGKIKPLVYTEIDHDGKPGKMVTDGHHRFVALKELGYEKVPVIMSDERGTETNVRDKEIDKQFRIYRRFKIGQPVYYFDSDLGAFDEGKIVSSRVGNNYQILNTATYRNHLIDGRQIRPREGRK